MQFFRVFFAAASMAVLAAAAVQAQEVGQPAPEVQASDWLNAPPLALSKLRGKIVVVEFWATWCPPCRATIPHLIDLHKKYAPKGVVIMSLTKEPKAKVEPFAKEMGMVYAIGCGSPTGQAYGVRGIPHAFVIDIEGRVVWHGHPAGEDFERAIENQLKTKPPTLMSTEEKAKAEALLAKADEALAKGALAGAAAALAQVKDAEKDPEVGKRVEALRERLKARAEARLAEADKDHKDGRTYEAYLALTEVAALAAESELASKAKDQLAKLLKEEGAEAAIEKGRREQQAADAVNAVEAKRSDIPPASLLKAYESLAATYADTEAGRTAGQRAKAMRSDTALMSRIANEAAEKDCPGWLSMARNFIKADLPDKARLYLEKVVKTYPDTSYAAEAKEMLEAMKK